MSTRGTKSSANGTKQLATLPADDQGGHRARIPDLFHPAQGLAVGRLRLKAHQVALEEFAFHRRVEVLAVDQHGGAAQRLGRGAALHRGQREEDLPGRGARASHLELSLGAIPPPQHDALDAVQSIRGHVKCPDAELAQNAVGARHVAHHQRVRALHVPRTRGHCQRPARPASRTPQAGLAAAADRAGHPGLPAAPWRPGAGQRRPAQRGWR